MKKKKLICIISGLGISLLTIASVVSCTTQNNSQNVTSKTDNNKVDNSKIANALTTYFGNINNQVALINYLVNNDYITYSNGTWRNYSTGSSWASAINDAIHEFITNNQNISYDGVLGSSINAGQYLDNGNEFPNNLLIPSASYSESNGLVFNISYNGVSASSNVTISAIILNEYSEDTNSFNVAIVNNITTYFGNSNNQIALIDYLLSNDYITYVNGTWYTNNFLSWDSALSYGISEFIANNQNISYDGILGSNINTDDVSITNASYSASSGLVFSIAYHDISASSSVNISNTISNDSVNNRLNIANALTAYFNSANNQIALINYLANNDYITYSNGTWRNYSTDLSWNDDLNMGIYYFISDNWNISYDGVLWEYISIDNLSITSASYSASSGLVFSIAYHDINANSDVVISATTLNDYEENYNSISTALTTYFSDSKNQIALIDFLVNSRYITYSNGIWDYDSDGDNYTSWDDALSAGISAFISANQNISYDGVLGININVGYYNYDDGRRWNFGDLSIVNASYSTAIGLMFSVAYNGVSASSNAGISASTLNNCIDENTNIAIDLTTYFSSANNQIALINYLANNDYITYSNGAWNYNKNLWIFGNDSSFTSWDDALSSGISAFIFANQNISYDGIWGSSMNLGLSNNKELSGYNANDLSITSASYDATSGLEFSIAYNGISASSITISNSILDDYNNTNTHLPSIAIVDALTAYFSNKNNQIALIKYSLNNGYIAYSNGTWNYNTSSSSAPNESGYTSWTSALSAGINAFISANQNISYDGILGSSINVGYSFNDNTGSYNANDLSITSASYSTTTGFVFTISYNDFSPGSNVSISTDTLNYYIKNSNSSNSALVTYFSDSKNQIALIEFLLNNRYITCTNGAWDYNTSSSASNENGYTSWDSALSSGISAFISSNQNISYDGVLGSRIDVGQDNLNFNGFNANNLSVTSASYSAPSGLVFTIEYNNISASSSVTISSTIFTTFNQYIENSNSSNSAIVNALTTYFSNNNNQMALIKYLLNNGYITYSNGIWDYDSGGDEYTSWDDALHDGISEFIYANKNISYDGVLGSNINHNYDLSITSASYSASSGLVFTIEYNNISASNNVTISSATFSQYIKNSNSSNSAIANALTTYFNNKSNQMALINYLVSNNYITYTNGTWNYDSDGDEYTSWDDALHDGISEFIYANKNISYDGVLGSNIHNYDLSITSASYDATNGLVFSIVYNGISATNKIDISVSSLNSFISENINISNALTNYFSNTNNQIALIKYLLNNGYITYSNGTWDYNTNSSISEVNNGGGYTSWDNALSKGISAFISANSNISYDGILGSRINAYYRTNNLSITSASYDSSNGLVFTIAYNNVNATSNITISNVTLNDSINSNS